MVLRVEEEGSGKEVIPQNEVSVKIREDGECSIVEHQLR
jgi:hypothetical protein